MKVRSDLVPTATLMAQRAVLGKRVVGNHRAAAFIPLLGTRLFGSRRHDAGGGQVASGKPQPQSPS
jgi:hypothetical protein